MNQLFLATTAAAACLLALPAAAQFQKPEDAIKYRQAAFTLMNKHFGRVAAMAQGKAPFDAKAAAEDATLVGMLAPLPFTAFQSGTDMDLPNRAKPEIWSKAADFEAKAETMQTNVAKFVETAKGGNLDAIKVAVGNVDKSCRSCHDDYRAKNYSK